MARRATRSEMDTSVCVLRDSREQIVMVSEGFKLRGYIYRSYLKELLWENLDQGGLNRQRGQDRFLFLQNDLIPFIRCL